jgi:hypothetical protein
VPEKESRISCEVWRVKQTSTRWLNVLLVGRVELQDISFLVDPGPPAEAQQVLCG